MIPDFPHNKRMIFNIGLIEIFLLHPDIAKSQFSNVRTQQKKFQLDQSYSYTYYEESLVSSNLNSNLLRFHCVHPNLHTYSWGNRVKRFQGIFCTNVI